MFVTKSEENITTDKEKEVFNIHMYDRWKAEHTTLQNLQTLSRYILPSITLNPTESVLE